MLRHAFLLGICTGGLLGCKAAGSGSEPPEVDPARVQTLLHEFVDAAERAQAAKDDAAERSAAVQRMRKAEEELEHLSGTAAGRATVSSVIDSRLAAWRKERDRIQARMDSMPNFGRPLTLEEKLWLKQTAPRTIRGLDFRIHKVEELKRRLGI